LSSTHKGNPMTEHVLSGLTKRRAELAGEAETLRARLAQIATDVGHLDAVIHQFDPDYALGSIRPKCARPEDAAGRGEISRFIMKVLREAAEPVATHDVVRRLMTERGQDTEDRRLVKQTMKRVGMAFSRQKALGTVGAIQGAGPVTLWEVAR
jgi:hypothetical protein